MHRTAQLDAAVYLLISMVHPCSTMYASLNLGPTHLNWAQDYPAQPFFLRVVSPRCVWYTGHVTAGGSICIEALSLSGGPNGWTSALCVESVLTLVITNMCASFITCPVLLQSIAHAEISSLKIVFAVIMRRFHLSAAQLEHDCLEMLLFDRDRGCGTSHLTEDATRLSETAVFRTHALRILEASEECCMLKNACYPMCTNNTNTYVYVRVALLTTMPPNRERSPPCQ